MEETNVPTPPAENWVVVVWRDEGIFALPPHWVFDVPQGTDWTGGPIPEGSMAWDFQGSWEECHHTHGDPPDGYRLTVFQGTVETTGSTNPVIVAVLEGSTLPTDFTSLTRREAKLLLPSKTQLWIPAPEASWILFHLHEAVEEELRPGD